MRQIGATRGYFRGVALIGSTIRAPIVPYGWAWEYIHQVAIISDLKRFKQLNISYCCVSVAYDMFLPNKWYLVYFSLSIRSPSPFVRTTACPLSNGANHARSWGRGDMKGGGRTHCCDRERGRQMKQSFKQTLLKIIQKFMLRFRQRLQPEYRARH